MVKASCIRPNPLSFSSHLLTSSKPSPMREPLPSIPVGTSLAGKTVIVTGGNSGIGWEFARQTLVLNASRVIITTRSEAKGRAAIAALRNDPEIQSANATARLEFFDLDLDDYDSGQEFVQRVKNEVPELDILLCNGGVNFFNYQTSKSGHERIMQGTSLQTVVPFHLMLTTPQSTLIHISLSYLACCP